MPIQVHKDRRTGRTYWFVEKYWPHRSGRFRRRVANKSTANDLWLKIQTAVANGSWPDLRRQLEQPPPQPVTVAEFADVYMEQYVKKHNRAPEFKTFNLKPIKRILGDIPLEHFTRADGHRFKKERGQDVYRGKRISPSTVNRGLSVLSNMLAYAVDQGVIPINPITRFRKFPKPEPTDRFLTLEEERQLVEAVTAKNLDVGLLTGFIGETALRLDDALHLTRAQLDLERRFLIKRTSKRGTVVHVPLSDYAMELLAQVPHLVGLPWVFTRPGTRDPMMEHTARRAFDAAKKKARLDWVGFHDLRRFRATQWYIHGVSLKDIKELLGHKTIETTMLYVKFAPTHAVAAVILAQKKEQAAVAALSVANK